MDPIIKEKWVKALRSGEYKQAAKQLQDGDRFCCLGVLCIVAGLEIAEDGNRVAGYGTDDPSDRSGYAPIYNILGGERKSFAVSTRNDDGKSFAEIADYIEANL